jgi:hypothetical protein
MGTDRALDAPPDAIAKARALVKDAIAKAAVHNKARLDNPSRNQYKLKPGTKIRNRRDQPPDTQPAPPLFNVTEEIADAAALLAEYDAAAELNATGTVKRDYSHIDVLHGRRQKYVQEPGGWEIKSTVDPGRGERTVATRSFATSPIVNGPRMALLSVSLMV